MPRLTHAPAPHASAVVADARDVSVPAVAVAQGRPVAAAVPVAWVDFSGEPVAAVVKAATLSEFPETAAVVGMVERQAVWRSTVLAATAVAVVSAERWESAVPAVTVVPAAVTRDAVAQVAQAGPAELVIAVPTVRQWAATVAAVGSAGLADVVETAEPVA